MPVSSWKPHTDTPTGPSSGGAVSAVIGENPVLRSPRPSARSYNASVQRLVIFVILTVPLLRSQYRELLRPEAIKVAAVVVDREGKPIPGVSVDHHGNLRQTVLTNADGRFELQTKAPALVLRKDGYRSHFMQVSATVQARVILDPAESAGTPKGCTTASHCESIEGWGAEFCFPKVAGVRPSSQGHDIDYGIRSYIVTAANEPAGIRHGSGPFWSFGTPDDTDVWKSVEYSEVSYAAGKLQILDARGRTSDGRRWRYVGRFGESATYRGVNEDAARLLDRVLDGMCVRR